MLRATLLRLLCFMTLAIIPLSASPVNPPAPSTPVQIVYAIDGSTLSTYNIDPATFGQTLVGTLTVEVSLYPYLVTSPNGHFLYFVASNGYLKSQTLFVYATDSSGVPIAPAVQKMSVNTLSEIQFDPAGNFAYLTNYFVNSSLYQTNYTLLRYLVDANTGVISQPEVQGKYVLPNFDAESCGFYLDGFNNTGTRLYDEIFCGSHGGPSAYYYERTIDPQTGALGHDAPIRSWAYNSGGAEHLHFVNNLVFDFVSPNDYQQGVNSVNIYPLVPNTSTPLVQCTVAMLEACGYAGWGTVHPSGEYLFMQIASDVIQIEKVDLTAKQIVGTASYIPYEFGQFSPDGTIVYSTYLYSTGLCVGIYGFDISTGVVTPGSCVYLPSEFDYWLAAARS